MARQLFLLAALGLMCGATTGSADDAKKAGKAGGKFDKAKVFEKMDADGNGKVTKEEFKKFADGLAEKMKAKGGKAEKLGKRLAGLLTDDTFKKMDTDGDGVVTKEEFEKFELPAAGKGKKKKGDGGE